MTIKPTLLLSAGLAVVALPSPISAQTVFPTGTTIYDPAEAYSSYILLRAMPGPEELAVTPPDDLEWRLEPDVRRGRGG